MTYRDLIGAILFLLICLSVCDACVDEDVAVYKVKLKFLWSEESFPKDYPDEAQWSKVFGQSHNKSYTLYRAGELASSLLRAFATSGSVEPLLKQGDEEAKVYDQFVAPAVGSGVGSTDSLVFVNVDHSLISFICRMIPSPGWFVGVDSLDLCVDSSWIDQVTLDLEPLDAGARHGPNIDEGESLDFNHNKPVERLSIHNLESPLSNFYSRRIRHMPAIAQVEFVKMKEYSNKELNDMVRKELLWNVKSNSQLFELPRSKSYYKDKSFKEYKDSDFNEKKTKERIENREFTTKNPFEQLKDLEEDPVGTPKPNNPENHVMVVTKAPEESEEEYEKSISNMDDVVLAVATGHKLGLRKHLPRHFKSRLHHAVNKDHHHDCIVSEWSKWSSCSDPCSDNGVIIRTRSIIREKRKGGKACPDLFEKKSCGHHCRGDDLGW